MVGEDGADVAMLCLVLMRRGIDHLRVIENEMCAWMEEHEYNSVSQLKGSLSQKNCPNSGAYERAQYVHNLTVSSDRYARGVALDKVYEEAIKYSPVRL